MYYQRIKNIIEELNFEEINTLNINKSDQFEKIVKGAFSKCVELSKIIHLNLFDKNSFLYLPQLRGICEELIVLKFINELFTESDKNEIIRAIFKSNLRKELKEQTEFIRKYRPAQPVLTENLADHFPGTLIDEILDRNQIKGSKIPPTIQMATKIGLSELYNFLYRASCSFVHFNPRIIKRTMWYENSQDETTISVTHFHRYYFAFSSFYITYLLGLMHENFKEILNLSQGNIELINTLKEEVRRKVHFPDLVTYEEVNFKRPKTELTVINEFLENQLFERKDYS